MNLPSAPPLQAQFERPSAEKIQPNPPQPVRGGGCGVFLRWYLFSLLLWSVLGIVGLALVAIIFPTSPTNILIIGLDRRPGESNIARSDTLILAHIDPIAPAIAMLSMPRDLWVTLPDGGKNRINTAHRFAELAVEGSGPAAAMQTVTTNFGIPVDLYVRIDFEGFVEIIDAIGGITLEVNNTFVDYQYPTDDGGTVVVSFDAGTQHINGERALQYARIRHGSSDFVRAARQQQIITAFVERLLQPAAWTRIPALFTALGTAVDTNVDLITMVRSAPTVARVGSNGIMWTVIEGSMVEPFTSAGGAAVQLPVWEHINPILVTQFGKN